MKSLLTILISLLFLPFSHAEDIKRDTITSCAYQAGTAYEIQSIRQTEGDTWDVFEANVKDIYADSEGRDDLLVIANWVFMYPAEKSLDFIHDDIMNACLERQQGIERMF